MNRTDSWQKVSSKTLADKEALSLERLDRWVKLWTPYADLSDDAKEQDRIWARKVMAILQAKGVIELRTQ